MKKIILPILLFVMFIPFYVNAETCDTDKISISSITVESKSDNVEETDEATANGRNINLNLSMSEVGDTIEYKILVKNDSNEDYELDKNSFNINSDYIDYTLTSEDNSNTVKAGEVKSVYLKAKYKKEVPDEAFESGKYSDNKTMSIQLSNGDNQNVLDKIKNPQTGVQSYIIILAIILLVSLSVFIVLKKKKYTKFMVLIIGLSIIIPISVYALCKCEITIESNVEIKNIPKCKSFESDDLETIISVLKSGDISPYSVGDEKEVDLGTLGTHTIRIANTTTPAECSTEGFSQTACGVVLEFSDIITTHNMNPSGTYNRTTFDYGWNVDGWPASSMRTYVNNDIYNALPEVLRNAIIDTTVVSGHGSTAGETNFTSTDKLYLLSTHEVYEDVDGITISGIDYYDTAYANTRQLDYYQSQNVTTSNYSGAIKQYNGSNYHWWLRSAYSYNTNNFYHVYYYGTWIASYAYNTSGVSPAFRIA